MSALGRSLVLDDCEHVALTHHQIFLVTVLKLCSGIFTIEHFVAFLKNHRLVLCALAKAVSGMMIPPTFSSAGAGSTSTLSANGLIVIVAIIFMFKLSILVAAFPRPTSTIAKTVPTGLEYDW